MLLRLALTGLLGVMLIGSAGAADQPAAEKQSADKPATDKPTATGIEFFEKKIRPVLVANCYQCHSAQAAQIKGGLVLDTRAGVLRGGETGPIVVPGDPEQSLLIQALRYSDDAPAMPPRKKLPDDVIADFVTWVKLGAPDPRAGKAAVAKHEIDVIKGRKFWSFVPPKAAKPPQVKDNAWPATTIDRFLLARIEERGLKPVGDADPYSLVRRLYFDLTGLPPSETQVTEFVSQISPSPRLPVSPSVRKDEETRRQGDSEKAYAELVDELLASPHFGERWGRHWLDVARFAETSGRQINYNYPQAWRYRDWVIAAFNADKPYDRFVQEQIAGDLLPADGVQQRVEQQIATGFLAIGPKPHSEMNRDQFAMDLVDEQIDATSQAFLGLTVACARCHDHKFDPIPQRDYYALAGIFRSSETCYGTIRIIQSLNPSPLVELPKDSGAPSALAPLTSEELAKLKQQLAELQGKFDAAAKGGKPTTGTEFNNLGTLTNRIASYTDDGRPKLLAMGVRERSKPIDSPLLDRGEIDKPGDVVPRGLVQVVAPYATTIDQAASGRLELARWIASRENPLTARVFVNRVWTQLFGRGLVPTPDNFGAAGMAPDHPQLLDHLAVSFMDDGWSVKRLIRSIVLSRAYRLSTQYDAKNNEADPDNALVWRMTPRRLEAEAIRDALLEFAGRLEKTPPVGSPVAQNGENGSNALLRQLVALDTRDFHRAVYLPVIRDNVLESVALFDFADPSLIVSQRAATTVPAQGLFLLNNAWVIAQLEATADRLLKESPDDVARVRLVYLRILGRLPTYSEQDACEAFLKRYPEQLRVDKVSAKQIPIATWAALCQSLVASADFLYRR